MIRIVHRCLGMTKSSEEYREQISFIRQGLLGFGFSDFRGDLF